MLLCAWEPGYEANKSYSRGLMLLCAWEPGYKANKSYSRGLMFFSARGSLGTRLIKATVGVYAFSLLGAWVQG